MVVRERGSSLLMASIFLVKEEARLLGGRRGGGVTGLERKEQV